MTSKDSFSIKRNQPWCLEPFSSEGIYSQFQLKETSHGVLSHFRPNEINHDIFSHFQQKGTSHGF